jgi:hypothetical protein
LVVPESFRKGRSQANDATVRRGKRLERRFVCDVGEMDKESI